jgi:hypothetical protein
VGHGRKNERKLKRLQETYGLASSLGTDRVRRVIIASAAECALRAESARAQYWLIKTSATTTHGARFIMLIGMYVRQSCAVVGLQGGNASKSVRALFNESTAMPSKNLCLS